MDTEEIIIWEDGNDEPIIITRKWMNWVSGDNNGWNQNIIDHITAEAGPGYEERFMFPDLWVDALRVKGIIKNRLTEKENDQLFELLSNLSGGY